MSFSYRVISAKGLHGIKPLCSVDDSLPCFAVFCILLEFTCEKFLSV
jgi:hypothetical protein